MSTISTAAAAFLRSSRVRGRGVALAGTALLLGSVTACGDSDAQALALEVPATDVAQMCAELTPEGIAAADTAFKGEVTDVTGDVVTLEVEERYTGEVPDQVTIPQQPDGQPGELSIGSLVAGEKYLISAQDGAVLTCGQSGPASDALESLYEAAYQQ